MRQYLKKGRYIEVSTKSNIIISEANFKNTLLTLKAYIRSRFSSKFLCYKHLEYDNHFPKFDKIIFRKIDGQILGFDFYNNFLYRIYNKKAQYLEHKNGYETIEKLFKLNKIEFVNTTTTKEKLIEGKLLRRSNLSNQNKVFKDIVERYNYTFNKNKFTYSNPRINIDTFFYKIFKIDFPSDMLEYIESEKDSISDLFKNIKWVWSHSDLTPDNIMFNDSNDYFIIDTERCEVLPAMYDIINLMLTSVLFCNNITPLEDYFDGKYDALIKNVISKDVIAKKDRRNLVIIMLVLKSILAWDVFFKKNESDLLHLRWNVFKCKFEEGFK